MKLHLLYLQKILKRQSILILFPENSNVVLEKDIEDFLLDVIRIFMLGIIINELFMNIMKYVFIHQHNSKVQISLKKNENTITIIIQDNGHGPPPEFDINESQGFGLMLIKILSEQMGGSFSLESNNGVKSTIHLKL